MKRNKAALILSSIALALGVFSFAGVKQNIKAKSLYNPGTTYSVSDTAAELDSYYSSVGSGDTGNTLLGKLRSINSSKYHKNFDYSDFGTSSATSPYVYTDYPIGTTTTDENGQIRGSSIASFYTKTTSSSFNKEHVWPNSKGGNKVEDDILMPRPTISSENSSRGNSNFVEGMNSSSGGWDPYTAGYDKECRGECARIMLYCVVASSQLSLVDSNSGGSTSCGNMNTLIKWHFDYAPSEYEMNRNNGAEYLQGNRNPFVDHPEYVAKIWSNFNSTVSNLCTANESKYADWTPGNYCEYGSNTPVNPNTGVTISNAEASVTVGSTTTLSATASNGGTISWTTSNNHVASLSSSSSASGADITITGVAAGTATITAKATIDGTQYSKTCTITVNKVVSSLSKGSTSPSKTTYTAGESFDPTGLTITATYSDSTTSDVTNSVVWTPDPLTVGTTSVTGTFGGKTITISGLTVNAPTEPELIDSNSDLSVGDYVILRTAAGIGVTGWNNNKDATVSETQSAWKRYYVDNTSNSGFTLKDETADDHIASPGNDNKFVYGDAATCSTNSNGHLICSGRYLCKNGNNYRFYNNVGSYLPFFIYKMPASSTDKTLSSISVSVAPNKVAYSEGEYFDPTGLIITRTYSDTTSDEYTYSGHTSEFSFTPTTSTALTTSDVSVTIKYGGKTCEQAITVSAVERTLSSISVSTAPNKLTYVEDEYFNPSGLVITRTYSSGPDDTYSYAGHESEFTFNPDLETELTTSDTSVTIYYEGKSCSQSIVVTSSGGDTPVTGGDATYVASEQGYSNEQVINSVTFDNANITAIFNKGSGSNEPKYFTSGAAIRLYAGGYFIVTSAKKNISKIVLTFGSSDKTNAITADKGSYSNGTWTAATGTYETSVKFTVGGTKDHRRIAGIAVTYYSISTFATDFLTGTGCDSSGKTAPSVNWTTMNNKFDLLFDDEQLALKKAEASESGTAIEQAVARYDYIVGKYGTSTYNDFIGRNPDPIPSGMNALTSDELMDNNMMIIMIIVSLISVSSLTALLVIKKKKHR